MSSAKRRLNYTGRKKITSDHVEVRVLDPAPGEPLRATMKLDLTGLDLPPSASVIVEPYHRSSSMKFDCGTVRAPEIPSVMTLDEIDQSGSVLFRIKVVDGDGSRGKILAAASRIRPASNDEGLGRRSLFPILHRDLGDMVWKVDVDGPCPCLILNNRIPSFAAQILGSPMMRGILLPTALKDVLTRLALDPSEDEEDDSPWKEDWMRYCTEELGASKLPDLATPDERNEWIEEVVKAFCRRSDFVRQMRETVGAHDDH
jgi:hypothetical protein